MKNTTSTTLFLVALLSCTVLLAGCNRTLSEVRDLLGGNAQTDAAYEPEAVKLNRETRYYNDFLGVSYAVPGSWWLYGVNEDNFSESRGAITDDVSMDIGYGKYDQYTYSSMHLISFGNLQRSVQDNHLGFNFDAQAVEGINNLAGFMEYYETYMLDPTEDEDYLLINSQQITIKGKPFEFREYLVSREEDNYHIVTLSCQVKNGYFLNMYVDYWPKNTRAKQTIIDSITKAVEFY
jgi:hypothetical protein